MTLYPAPFFLMHVTDNHRDKVVRDLVLQTHPRVAVDAVLFTIADRELKTLLVKIKKGPFVGRWAFPGGLVQVGESLDDAARRELSEKTGVQDLYLEQLYTFGDAQRDPVAHTVAVAYFALVPYFDQALRHGEKYEDVGWFRVRALPRLAYDHNAIAAYALQRLQAKLGYTNIVYSLLPREFTVAELQDIYEVILNEQLDRRNFRRVRVRRGTVNGNCRTSTTRNQDDTEQD